MCCKLHVREQNKSIPIDLVMMHDRADTLLESIKKQNNVVSRWFQLLLYRVLHSVIHPCKLLGPAG